MSCLDQNELWVMSCGHVPVKTSTEVMHLFCMVMGLKITVWVVGACL